MFNLLISLMIASQLAFPLSGIVLGASTLNDDYPKRKITGSFEPVLEAEAAFVLDMKTGKVLFQKNGYQPRPIASITKLLTAIVFIAQGPNWNENATTAQDDKANGGVIVLKPGEAVNLRDLFKLSLIASANNAADALARSTVLSYDEFIAQMNKKVKELGMEASVFFEPTGVDARNSATAEDVARLLRAALNDSLIRETLLSESYEFKTIAGQSHKVKNTNKLLQSYLNIEGGKTGYIDEAGFCLANLVTSEFAPAGIVVVILGAKTKEQRFQENKFLSQWVFDNWEWQ